LSRPSWGRLYQLALPGARAELALVVSEDDWNQRTRDAVIVPVYREQDPQTSNVRVAVGEGLVADCTRVQNLVQEFLGEHVGACPAPALTRVRIGIRVYLDIDRLIAKQRRGEPPRAREEWWPRQAKVHYALEREVQRKKLFAIFSDDDWNSRPQTRYSAAVRLTSKRRDWREGWEVEVPGGCVVAGHLYSLLHADLDQKAPPASKPRHLEDDELAEIAARLAVLLRLR
jgi:mRNA-degrading endonuclease toxin of MazEF toxin-antitoxin module